MGQKIIPKQGQHITCIMIISILDPKANQKYAQVLKFHLCVESTFQYRHSAEILA